MTSYYDSTYRRLEQYFTWNSEESLTNALDIFLHKSFAYYHKYILRYFMCLLQKLRYQSRHSFLRQDSTLDGEDYRILFEKSFYQKKLKISFQHDDYWILLSMSRTMELHYLTSQIQLRFHESLSRKLQRLLILLLAWIFFLERSRHNSIKDIVPLCITNASIDELFHFRNQLNR